MAMVTTHVGERTTDGQKVINWAVTDIKKKGRTNSRWCDEIKKFTKCL